MKTYKLPIVIESEEDKSYIQDLCRQQSIIVRSSYNHLQQGKLVKELEKEYKLLNSIPDMDSWFIRCGILRGKMLTKHKNVVFGGKKNLSKLTKGKITKQEWKAKRLYPIETQGEENQGGNRKFELDLENNKLWFKPNKKHRIEIKLPIIRSKWKHELQHIQEISACFTVRLSTSSIEIIVDEKHFVCQEHIPKVGRILGLDLNPDYIGLNITDFPSEKVVKKLCFETTKLNQKSRLASNHPKSKYLKNKRKHEYIHIVKDIIELAKVNHVEKIVVEDLNIKSKDYGNKSVNRKNNYWMRNIILTKLKMDAKISGIEVIEVNSAYSSVVGNLVYDDFDPVSSSREISRRGYYKFEKGKFYPSLQSVKHQWKEMVTEDMETWVQLHSQLKTRNIRYRVPLNESYVVSRHSYIKKNIHLYSFILK
jgi:IS605 OrfB family transposase